MSSRQLEERWEREQDQTVADFVGLTLDQYDALDPEVTQDESSAGMHTGYILTFRNAIPDDLRAKLKALEGDFIRLPLNLFDSDEEDHPQ